MEVKIGVQNAVREIVLESAQSAEEVTQTVSQALRDRDGVLNLADDKGRQVLVPVSAVAYVEIGAPETRRVGFGAM